MPLKGKANSISVVAAFAAMNNFPAKRNLLFEGSDLRLIAKLPHTTGNHAGAMGTDVFSVGQLSRIDRMFLDASQVHNNGDRQTFFHSSVKSRGNGHMAMSGRGQSSRARADEAASSSRTARAEHPPSN